MEILEQLTEKEKERLIIKLCRMSFDVLCYLNPREMLEALVEEIIKQR